MNNSSKVHQITRMAILVAIIFLLAFTPLGYLTIGPIAATTIQMPVIVGAVMMLLCYTHMDTLLGSMGPSPEVFAYCRGYLRRYLLFTIPILLMYSAESVSGHDWTTAHNRADAVLDVNDIRRYGLMLGPDVTCIRVVGGLHDLYLSSPRLRTLLYARTFAWLASLPIKR